jgi:hypothetical protein
MRSVRLVVFAQVSLALARRRLSRHMSRLSSCGPHPPKLEVTALGRRSRSGAVRRRLRAIAHRSVGMT